MVFKGVRLFQRAHLLFFPNFPGGMFIPDGTIIPYFRVAVHTAVPTLVATRHVYEAKVPTSDDYSTI